MKKLSLLMALMLSLSLISGCTGGDETSQQKDSEIESLLAQVDNLTTQNLELNLEIGDLSQTLIDSNDILFDIESRLISANESLESMILNLADRNSMILNLTTQINVLHQSYQDAIENQSDEISELESQISNLSNTISLLEQEVLDAENEISIKENEILELTNTLQAALDRYDMLTTELYFDVQDCPLSNPGPRLKIGYDDGGQDISESDGNLTGTEVVTIFGECPGDSGLVRDIHPGISSTYQPENLVTMGGILYFTADDGVHGRELWRSDGTLGGTYMIKDLTPPTQTIVGGALVDINPGTDFGEIVAGDEKIFFSAAAGDERFNGIRELYVTDGTEVGTEQVSNIFWCTEVIGGVNSQFPEFVYSGVNSITVIPASERGFDVAYFSAFICNPWWVGGEEPWFSDGTESGTTQITDLRSPSTSWPSSQWGSALVDMVGSQPRDFKKVGNKIFFSANADQGAVNTDVGRELFVIDTSSPLASVELVKDIRNGDSNSDPVHFESMGGSIYFTADDGIAGEELWKSDGTLSGTSIVSNIAENGSDSSPGEKLAIGGELFFVATDDNGRELWKSDGTNSGTSLVKNIANGSTSSNVRSLTSFEGTLYFTADDGMSGDELWKSDGTESGTVMIQINEFGYGSHPDYLTPLGDRLYFAAYDSDDGDELHYYESASNTTSHIDINSLSSSNPRFLTPLGNKLFLVGNDGLNGSELRFHWKNPGPIILELSS
ncbi:MAG: hypothetical protein CMA21_02255 [Euryarchaeota archaeon]|nr:hypothetical protein [Euryarchaeota archaeon]